MVFNIIVVIIKKKKVQVYKYTSFANEELVAFLIFQENRFDSIAAAREDKRGYAASTRLHAVNKQMRLEAGDREIGQ